MLTLAGECFQNVEFQSPTHPFEGLCEKQYLTDMIKNLRMQLGRTFEEYRFIIYSKPRQKSPENVDLRSKDPNKTVVIYISDEAASVPKDLCTKVLAVFKNYLPREGIVKNLFSFPLGYVESTPYLEPIPINDRKYNLFFSGHLNSNRIELYRVIATPSWSPFLFSVKLINRMNLTKEYNNFVPSSYIRFTDSFRGGASGEEYAKKLIGSKLAICPKGYKNVETFRHFEAMRAGAIVVSEELPPLDCYRGSPIISLSSWRDLKGAVRKLLRNRELLASTQQETISWYENHCSEKAVASRIAERIS